MRCSLVVLVLLISALILTACGTSRDYDDLQLRMVALDDRPSGRVPSVPEYDAQDLFFYSASDRRSPFRDPRAEEEFAPPAIVDSGLAPDLDRPAEDLEAFDLDQLRMLGHIQREADDPQALIADPSGQLHRVRTNQYLGKNYGRVMRVTPQRVELMEIVPNGLGGWLERPQSLSVAQ